MQTFHPGDRIRHARPSAGTWCGLAAATLLCASGAASAQTFTTLDRFSSTTGSAPTGSLIQGTSGDIYGATLFGGTASGGTVYKLKTSGQLGVLSDLPTPIGFSSLLGVIQASDGTFYGVDISGGANSAGSIYRISSSGTLATIYSFCAAASCADGQTPAAALVQGRDGNLYGTTAFGGANGEGTVFSVTTNGTLRTLYSFCSQSSCTDGEVPTATLIQATDGNFYGTTQQGGTNGNDGTVFRITPAGTLTTVYSFCALAACADGQYPLAGLVQGTDGNLYGTTLQGGANGQGGVFQLTTGGVLRPLYSFCALANCADGQESESALIQASDGNLYGVTYAGGANGAGTIFRVTPGGTFTTLYSLCSQSGCADGSNSESTLLEDTNGTLYGTTVYGGTGNLGTVFSLAVGLAPFVALPSAAGEVGSKVAILGTNLTGATGVTFNGTSATFRVVSASEISATVPTGASSGPVQVLTPAGTLTSAVAYGVEPKTAEPTFSPRAGSYATAQVVKIADASAGAAIFYTTDGSTPTTASTPYTGPVTVASSETLKALALAPASMPSAVKSGKYTIE